MKKGIEITKRYAAVSAATLSLLLAPLALNHFSQDGVSFVGTAVAEGKPDAVGGKGGPHYMGGKDAAVTATSGGETAGVPRGAGGSAGGKGAPGTGGQGEPGAGGKGQSGSNNVKLGRLNLAKAWLSPGFDTTTIDTSETESPLVKLDLYTKVIVDGNILATDPPDVTNPDGTVTVVGYPDAFAAELGTLSAYDLMVWCVGKVATTLPVTQAAIVTLNEMLDVTATYDVEAFANDVTQFVLDVRASGE